MTVYKELIANLYELLHHKVYTRFILRQKILNDTETVICLNDIIEYIIDDVEEKQQLSSSISKKKYIN